MAAANEVSKAKIRISNSAGGSTNTPPVLPVAEQGLTFAEASELAKAGGGPNLRAVCPVLPAPGASSAELKWKVVEYKQEDVIPINTGTVRISDNRSTTATAPEVPSAGRWLKLGSEAKPDVVYLPDFSGAVKPEPQTWMGRAASGVSSFFSNLAWSTASDFRETTYYLLGKVANQFLQGSLKDPHEVIDLSRAEIFKENAQAVAKLNGKMPQDWSDFDRAADRRLCLRKEDLKRLEPGFNVLIEHDSTFDSPRNPKYQLVSWSDAWRSEKIRRERGAYNFTGTTDKAKGELNGASMYLAGTLAEAAMLSANPQGDTSIHKIYDYARFLAGEDRYSPSIKRGLILNYTRQMIGDDQTLQSGSVADKSKVQAVTIREAVMEKAGVCRHLAGILYGAYNIAGIKTELHSSDQHQWVESYDKGGTVVTVDPNAFYNYAEFPGSRGGSYADSQGKVIINQQKKK